MTNKKTTKKALVMSVLALALCFSMLIGTTYAWFTDSVTSGSNVITAGNLDIVVEYTLDGETWNDLDGADDLFQKGLWEPGHTEVVALKITNKGTLALKYAASMNIFNETEGKTKDGQDIVLSDILTVGTLVQQANAIGDIALGLAFGNENDYKGTTPFTNANILGENQELLPGDAHYVIIKVDMAETVGNEANHDGEHVPTIEFGITVLATQFTKEEDSFGNQYDKDAEYAVNVNTIDGLANALKAEENIVLTDDVAITADNKLSTNYGFLTYNSSIDGDGKTITDDSAAKYAAFYAGSIDYVRNLTLKTNSGYGIFVQAVDREMNISNVTIEKSSLNSVIYADGSTNNLILDNVVATGTGTATGSFAHAVVFATVNSNITINSGTYTATDANGHAVASFYSSVVTINGGTFTGKLTTDGTGKIVIKGGTFSVDPSAFVAAGYVATANNGVWTVTAQ